MGVFTPETEVTGLTDEQRSDFALAESFDQMRQSLAWKEIERLLEFFVAEAERTVTEADGVDDNQMRLLVTRWRERKNLRKFVQTHVDSFLASRAQFIAETQGESE